MKGESYGRFPARALLAVLLGSRLRRTEMNYPSASAHIAVSREQRSATETRLHGRRLVLFWIGWVLLVAYTLGVFFGSLPFYFAQLQTVCTSGPCATGQPLASTVLLLHGLGFSLASYALLIIALTILAAFIAFAVAGVLAWRKPDDWMALLAALALVMLVTANSTYTILQIASPWQVPAILLNILTWGVIFLVFCLIPNGRFVPRWTRWVAVIWMMYDLILLLFFRLPYIKLLENIIWSVGLACVVVALIYRYRVISTPVERQQTKWIVFGWSATILLTIVWNLPQFLFPSFARSGTMYDLALAVFNSFLLLPVTLCVAIAILRYRLWDIDILINRTLVYGSLTAILALVYFVSIIALQALFGVFTGHLAVGPQTPVVIVASTLGTFALFQPLRRRLQGIINRRFYRSKYDAARTLATFSESLRNEVDLHQLSEQLLTVVQETMQPTHVSLWLRNTEPSSGRSTRLLPEIDATEFNHKDI
jgi:hypothetical protein